ncbi:hypothetical protein NP233_g1844 [Leucocoprinus birnbaumii]|uniref:Uncharacterized protein n=1 Tax=Leucocoprinus birnbaumii TaxID=56174 RepID=A0AAD5VZ93_9AGAR|nr:hypothetical protein NP233_g1844 [Leucocoprinus birnbaumii]
MRLFRLRAHVEHDSGESSHTSDPSLKSKLKRGIYARAAAFFLLEFSFIAFAYYCLLYPIPIQPKPSDTLEILSVFNATLTEAKSAAAATSVVWQAIACLFIKDIISIVRSAEFMAQYRQLGELTPGVSDRVSTITSGVIDALVHFVGDSSTEEFRLMFIAMLAVMTVGPLGSATITVGTTILHTTTQIEIANVTSPSSDGVFSLFTSTVPDSAERTNLIMQLENKQHTVFGYQMGLTSELESFVLIPWPHLGEGLGEESTLTYQSDILQFSFQCSWATPKMTSWYFDAGLEVNGRSFVAEIKQDAYYGKSNRLGVVLWLTQLDVNLGIIALNRDTPYTDVVLNNTFLFFQDMSLEEDNMQGMNGSNTVLLGGFSVIPSASQVSRPHSPKSSFSWAALTCDSHSSLTTAEITLKHNSLFARELPGSVPIHNISPLVVGEIANYPLARSLVDTNGWEPNYAQLNNVLKDVFLTLQNATNPPDIFPELHPSILQLKILPLDDINRNMNQYSLSGAKAFLDGFKISHRSTYGLNNQPDSSEEEGNNSTTNQSRPLVSLIPAHNPFANLPQLKAPTLTLHQISSPSGASVQHPNLEALSRINHLYQSQPATPAQTEPTTPVSKQLLLFNKATSSQQLPPQSEEAQPQSTMPQASTSQLGSTPQNNQPLSLTQLSEVLPAYISEQEDKSEDESDREETNKSEAESEEHSSETGSTPDQPPPYLANTTPLSNPITPTAPQPLPNPQATQQPIQNNMPELKVL